MTIGALLDWNGVAVMISDIMLTGGGGPIEGGFSKGRAHVDRVSQSLEATGTTFGGLVRKMVDIIPGRLSYCWAGRLVEACAFDAALRHAFGEVEPTAQLVDEFVATYPAEDARELQVIVLLGNGVGWTSHTLNTVPWEMPNGQTVITIGEGTPDAYASLEWFDDFLLGPFSEWGLAMVVAMIVRLGDVQARGIANRWGIGLEVRSCERGRIKRIDRILASGYRAVIGQNSEHTWEHEFEYFSEYAGEIALFHHNGTPVGALPHAGVAPRMHGLTVTAEPVYAVVGIQIEYGFLGWVKADPTGFEQQSARDDGQRWFATKTETMNEVWRLYQLLFPRQAEAFLAKRTRTKHPREVMPCRRARMRARRKAARTEQGRWRPPAGQ